ncbi:TetR/AcrR family transcriptional regulator [uncultured Martelella sp.]|uniref:TetR/AcrR family transcriptional regulator n=1 Tax=uncultured Martelella sp. TaxID=392331 RepID=UPI0029C73D4B|nr:TetR/AcrR family transcriptional regulator [uncultured Martelella sp.]
MPELSPVHTTVDARDRILEAALSVFSEVGFSGATMRAIAEEAGVSPGLIHHHFKDKESLWNLVGERTSDDLAKAVSAIPDDAADDPARALRHTMASYQRYWKEHPRALRFQLWRVLGAPVEERKSRSQFLNSHFVPKIRQAQEAGLVRDDIPAGLAMTTVGGLIQYFLHSDIEIESAIGVTGDTVPDDDQLLDYFIGLIAPPADTGPKD